MARRRIQKCPFALSLAQVLPPAPAHRSRQALRNGRTQTCQGGPRRGHETWPPYDREDSNDPRYSQRLATLDDGGTCAGHLDCLDPPDQYFSHDSDVGMTW